MEQLSLGYPDTRVAPSILPEPLRIDLPEALPGRHQPVVYFVRNGTRIKIGFTVNLVSRLAGLGLRRENVALLLEGGRHVEGKLHQRFAETRVSNTEWFQTSSDLLDYIARRSTEPAAGVLTGALAPTRSAAPARTTVLTPEQRPSATVGVIAPEIAEKYDRSLHAVTKDWTRRPGWPPTIGKRGRYKEYDAQAVDTFVRDHVLRRAVELDVGRLYTAAELEAAGAGITAGTIRADRSRGRWPEPDDRTHGVDRWRGDTAARALASRRGYHRAERGD